MTTHLTVRLAWHDRGWDGHVCDAPLLNASCVQQRNIREARDADQEGKLSGTHFSELKGWLPPCSRDPGVYASRGYRFVHEDPLERDFLLDTPEDLPPYSCFAAPYRWMREENFRDICEAEDLVLKGPYDPKKVKGWVSEPDRQRVLLARFWSKIVPEDSLIFFYCNQGNPVEDALSRLVVGVGRVKELGPPLVFESTRPDERFPVWQRRVTQAYPEEGFRPPYHEYLKAGLDAKAIACEIPEASGLNFSYVSEHISDDLAVGVLERLIESVQKVIEDNKVPGPWARQLDWLNDVLAEVWTARGAYPGAGSVLQSLGFHQGTAYQRTQMAPGFAAGRNAWAETLRVLKGEAEPETSKFQDGLMRARAGWKRLPDPRQDLLQLLARFELTPGQVSRFADSRKRADHGISASDTEIIENPYLLYERDLGDEESSRVSLETIDHGMIPEGEAIQFMTERERIASNDRRRLRAILVSVLETAARSGDTFLGLDAALRSVEGRFPERRRCQADRDLVLGDRDFHEEVLSVDLEDYPRLALKHLSELEVEVRDTIEARLERGPFPKLPEIDWSAILSERLGSGKGTKLPVEVETRARKEKTDALQLLFENRFAVLTGRAGTGKTSVIDVFLAGLERKLGKRPVLLLAPTGKARVRLATQTSREAFTIHQFLLRQDWFDPATFALKTEGGTKASAPTVIIDECSMIPMDLLGVLFRALDLNKVERLVLVGDPNQLPPIGPGRPFVDLVSWLENDGKRSGHLAVIRERARQEAHDSVALRLADGYLRETPNAGDDEILAAVARGESAGDLQVHFWNTVEELDAELNARLLELLNLGEGEKEYEGFNRSLGAAQNGWSANEAEAWQILSPTRILPSGTAELNRVIQQRFKQGLLRNTWPRPFGEQEIVWTDKVIQNVNQRRKGWPRGVGMDYVANGEIGIVTGTSKESDALDVTFSTQLPVTYRYFRNQVDDNLELAYAITVHKAQGSDFDVVILVLPLVARTLSRELLYTALTRFRKRLVLLLEKDTTSLEAVRQVRMSDTLFRNSSLFDLSVRPEDVTAPFPAHLVHRTSTGVLVRSKSELVIAEVLSELGISYEYEKRLESPKNAKDFRLPDFTVSYQGDTYYWEHLGMMDVPSYREAWERKQVWYDRNGYSDRLVVTQDGPKGELDAREIKRVAKERIIGGGAKSAQRQPKRGKTGTAKKRR